MAGDPTGYSRPHPDLRHLACDSVNQMRSINQTRQDASDRWPQSPVTVEDVAVRCQSTWDGVGDSDDAADRANYSVAIIDVASGERVASFMLEAVQPPEGGEWQRLAMPGGIGRRRDSADERESVMFFLGTLMSVGAVARSERSASFRVEYAGSSFESPFVDNYAIVLTPTISPAYLTEAATFSWVGQDGEVLDSTQIGPGAR